MFTYKRESSLVLYEGKGFPEIVSMTAGQSASVEFDFLKVWSFTKKVKKFDPAKLHFIHVHPPGFETASALDVECAKGLSIAFGHPVLFSVVAFKNGDILDIEEHSFNTYIFADNTLRSAAPEILWDQELMMLKTLSYVDEP